METCQEKLVKTAERLGLEIDSMPRHIAIIMDGNGRWAEQRSLPRAIGHQQGGRTVEKIALYCSDLGIESLVLYSFSMENWSRPTDEVAALMYLYTQYLIGIRNILMKNNVKLIHLGRIDGLPEEMLKELDKTIEITAGNTGMTLALALNYGGRTEIIDAAKAIAREHKEGRLKIEDIDEDCMSRHLYTAGLPEPDLLIRTANEMRISNFLLWQISYSEFYVTDTLWPDFQKTSIEEAIAAYAKRNRRFGNINEEAKKP